MVQVGQVFQVADVFEVAGQVEELAVLVPVQVGFAEWPDPQTILLVEQEVTPDVVEHDRVLARVHVWKLAPDNCQRFHLRAISM